MRWFSLLERKSRGLKEMNKSLIMQKVVVVWKEIYLLSILLMFKQKELNLNCAREDSAIQFGRENFLMERKLKMLKQFAWGLCGSSVTENLRFGQVNICCYKRLKCRWFSLGQENGLSDFLKCLPALCICVHIISLIY